jgi:hypothetical protein
VRVGADVVEEVSGGEVDFHIIIGCDTR